MDKLQAVIYLRVSDQSQIENNSLETQLKSCQNFADNNNYEVVRVFRDEGKSGKHVQTRPEMRNMLEYCTLKRNQISAVIVYKMDRWTRNTEEGLIAISLLAKYGVVVLPATEITEQNPMGKAMRTILMALGELDNNLKGERVRDNMITMFRNGLWCWKPPIGYKRPFKSKEENKGKPPIIDRQLGEVVKALFIKASENISSKKYLADYINKLGFKELFGKEADGKLVSTILHKTFYYGYMYGPKWKEFQWGKHLPLIDQETWEKAHMNVFGRKRKYNVQDSTIFPLKGLLLCAKCFHPMTSSNPRGSSKNYLYYECHNDEGKNRCIKRERIGIVKAHQQFIELLGLVKPTIRVLKLFTHLVFSEWDEIIDQAKREAEIQGEQIKKLEDKLTAIAEGNSKGLLTDEEAFSSAEKVRKDIVVLRIERSDTRIEQYNTEAVKSFTEDFLLHLDKLWLRMELPQKQALQSEIFPKGLLVENGKIRTVGLASTFELISAMKDENFHFVTPRGFEPLITTLKTLGPRPLDDGAFLQIRPSMGWSD